MAAALQFTSPVDIPISLAGNFGEPRPNHFHGGIDVRTDGGMGLPVFSVADGYVSRIIVGTGYGNAIYVSHPNGVTTFYCHLNGFATPLRSMVSKERRMQNQPDVIDRPRHSSPVLDLRLKPMQFPVSAGQLIAWSGNTGASMGPHLHLEFHETQSGALLDPLDYMKDLIVDTIAPEIVAVMACPKAGEGVFNGDFLSQRIGVTSSESVGKAWGKIGFSILADDHMNDTYHRLGVRRTELLVDDSVVFWSDVDRIPITHNRMVNAWGDYAYWKSKKQWFMKSFVEPGNPLAVVHTNASNGYVNFSEERPYRLTYILTDAFGNSSSFTFMVIGERQPLPLAPRKNGLKTLRWNRVNSFQMPGLQLDIPKWRLADDVELQTAVDFVPDGFSDIYWLNTATCPLFSWASLSIRLKRSVTDTAQLHIFCGDKDLGGTCHEGWITTRIRDIDGPYEVRYVDPDIEQPI